MKTCRLDELSTDLTILIILAQNVMDKELKGKTKSRNLDRVDEDGGPGMEDNEGLAENAHVLNNLLQSLEASGGTSGPVPNMLKEMGTEPPKLSD